MLCLFRNTKIHPSIDRFAQLFSWLAVAYWLYFTFIEKALMSKLFEGKALIVDLVFGLPLVLAMAVVVYATIYWLIKLIIIFLLPQAIEKIEPDDSELVNPEVELSELEQQHGKEYWQKDSPEDQNSISGKQEDNDSNPTSKNSSTDQ